MKLSAFERRKNRTRSKVRAANKSLRPRLVVFKSNKNFYAQLLEESTGLVVASASSLSLKNTLTSKQKGVDVAASVGKFFAQDCLKKGFEAVVFDKGAYLYTGRVKSFADSCRNNGLKF